jgi:hypothetical protein
MAWRTPSELPGEETGGKRGLTGLLDPEKNRQRRGREGHLTNHSRRITVFSFSRQELLL